MTDTVRDPTRDGAGPARATPRACATTVKGDTLGGGVGRAPTPGRPRGGRTPVGRASGPPPLPSRSLSLSFPSVPFPRVFLSPPLPSRSS